jgi:hypothetical protein
MRVTDEEREPEDALARQAEQSAAGAPAEDEDEPLVRERPMISRRRDGPLDLRRQPANADEEGEGSEESDEGLAQDAGAQAEVPEDEDLAPGAGNDTLSPRIRRSPARDIRRSPRAIQRQAEEDEGAAQPAGQEPAEGDDEEAGPGDIQARLAGPAGLNVAGLRQSSVFDGRSEQRQTASFVRPERSGHSKGPAGDILLPPGSWTQSGRALVRDFAAPEVRSRTRGTSDHVREKFETMGPDGPFGSAQTGSALDAGDGNLLPEHRMSDAAPGAGRNMTISAAEGAFARDAGRRSVGGGPPDIQISIGRIEIRTSGDKLPVPHSPPPGGSPAGKTMSLEDYLERRNGEVS